MTDHGEAAQRRIEVDERFTTPRTLSLSDKPSNDAQRLAEHDEAQATLEEFEAPEGFRIAQSGRTVTLACGHSSGGVWVHIPGQGKNGRETAAHRGSKGPEWLRGRTFEQRVVSARAAAARCLEAHDRAIVEDFDVPEGPF